MKKKKLKKKYKELQKQYDHLWCEYVRLKLDDNETIKVMTDEQILKCKETYSNLADSILRAFRKLNH